MNKYWRHLIFFVAVCLSGCQSTESSTPKVMAEIDEQFNAEAPVAGPEQDFEVPEAVLDDILSGQKSGGITVTDDPHFNVVAQDVAVRPFFASLIEGTPYSVIIHPEVTGIITLNLKEVTLFEAIEAVKELYGFDIRKKGKIFSVRPPGLRTETFAVNYLMMSRNGTSSVTVSAGGVAQADGGNTQGNQQGGGNLQGGSNLGRGAGQQGAFGGVGQQFSGSNILTTSETDFWKDLQKTLRAMIGLSNEQSGAAMERTVVVSPMTGLVTVRAYPHEINAIAEFLQRSEQTLRRQVILEAKIVEVSLNDDFQQGINWQQALTHVASTDFIFSNTAGVAANALTASLGGVTNVRFNNADFTGVISLLETQGSVQILSSPRVTATNNQKAVIKVGQDEYFVTDVSTTTTTGTSTTTTPELTLTPFFSGIALDVTPQINEHNEVILHIHPSVTQTSEQEKVVSLSGDSIVLPLAQSNIRESDTIIRAKSGEIVVIGGLMQSSLSDNNSKTPGLGDIPIIGGLFTQKSKVETKKELVILVKATVVGAGTWKEQLERSSDLLKSWYTE